MRQYKNIFKNVLHPTNKSNINHFASFVRCFFFQHEKKNWKIVKLVDWKYETIEERYKKLLWALLKKRNWYSFCVYNLPKKKKNKFPDAMCSHERQACAHWNSSHNNKKEKKILINYLEFNDIAFYVSKMFFFFF